MSPKVILALPAYNEAANLEPLLTEAQRVFEASGLAHVFIVVNDGSTDATGDVLERLAASLPLSVVMHETNCGLGAAIMSALRASAARTSQPDDVIVNMDADNTHDPKFIPPMAEKIWREGNDIVIASRFREGSEEVGVPFFRRLLSRGARMLFRICLRLPGVRDYTCGYRAYRAAVVIAALEKYGDRLITRQGFACTDELLVHMSTVTRRITEVPFVLRYDQKRGRSKLPLLRTIIETVKMLLYRD